MKTIWSALFCMMSLKLVPHSAPGTTEVEPSRARSVSLALPNDVLDSTVSSAAVTPPPCVSRVHHATVSLLFSRSLECAR